MGIWGHFMFLVYFILVFDLDLGTTRSTVSSTGSYTVILLQNPGNICLWIPESRALECVIPIMESGISLLIGIRYPSFSDEESGIQHLESGIQEVESRTTTVLAFLTSDETFHPRIQVTYFSATFRCLVFKKFLIHSPMFWFMQSPRCGNFAWKMGTSDVKLCKRQQSRIQSLYFFPIAGHDRRSWSPGLRWSTRPEGKVVTWF